MKYRMHAITKGEREQYENVLMCEVELQNWFALTYSVKMDSEITMCLQ